MSGSQQAKSSQGSSKQQSNETATTSKSKSTGKLKTPEQDAPPSISVPIKHTKGKAKYKNKGWSILGGLERFMNRTKEDSLIVVDINNVDEEDVIVDRSAQTSKEQVGPPSTVEALTTEIEKLQRRKEQIMSGSKPGPSQGPGTSGENKKATAPAPGVAKPPPNVKDDSPILSHMTSSKPSAKPANTDKSQKSPISNTEEIPKSSDDLDRLDNPSILTQLGSKSKTVTKGQPETQQKKRKVSFQGEEPSKRKVSFKGEEPASILSFLASNPREQVTGQQEPASSTNEVPGPSRSDSAVILYQRPTESVQSRSNMEKSTIFDYVSKRTLPKPTQANPEMPKEKEESTVNKKLDDGAQITNSEIKPNKQNPPANKTSKNEVKPKEKVPGKSLDQWIQGWMATPRGAAATEKSKNGRPTLDDRTSETSVLSTEELENELDELQSTLPQPTQEKPEMPKKEAPVDKKIDDGASIMSFLVSKPRVNNATEKPPVDDRKIDDRASIMSFLVSKPPVKNETERSPVDGQKIDDGASIMNETEKSPVDDQKIDDRASIMGFLVTKPPVNNKAEKSPVDDKKIDDRASIMGFLVSKPPVNNATEKSPADDDKLNDRASIMSFLVSKPRVKEETDETIEESPVSEVKREEIANPPAGPPISDKKEKEIAKPANSPAPAQDKKQEQITKLQNSPVSEAKEKEIAQPATSPASDKKQEQITKPQNSPVPEANQKEITNPATSPAPDKKQEQIPNAANTDRPAQDKKQEPSTNPGNTPVSEANQEQIKNSEIKPNKQEPPANQTPKNKDKQKENEDKQKENVMGRNFPQERDNPSDAVTQQLQNTQRNLVDRSAQTSEVQFATSSNTGPSAQAINELQIQARPTSVDKAAQTSELELPITGQASTVGKVGKEVDKLQDRPISFDKAAQTSELNVVHEELPKSMAEENKDYIRKSRERSVQFLQNDRPSLIDGSSQTSDLELRSLLHYLSLKQLLSEEDALVAAASGIDQLQPADSEVQGRQISSDKSCQTSEINLAQPSAQDELKKSIDESRPTTLQDGSTTQEVETQERPISSERSSQTPEPQSGPEGLVKSMSDERRDDLGDDSTTKSVRNSGRTSVDRSSQSTQPVEPPVGRSSAKDDFTNSIDKVQDIKCLIKDRLLGILLNDPEMEELVCDILMGICGEFSNEIEVEAQTAAVTDPQKQTEPQVTGVSTQTEYKQYAHCLQIEEESCRQQRSSRMFAYFCPLQCDDDSYDEDGRNYYQNNTHCWQPPTNCFCHNQRSQGNEQGSRRNTGTANDQNQAMSMSLQDAFRQCHNQCYQRVRSRQQSVTNSKRTRESVKAFAEKFCPRFKQQQSSSSSKGQSGERTGYSGRSRSDSRSCRPATSPDGESNYENEPCEAFTYVVPKSHVYWRCI